MLGFVRQRLQEANHRLHKYDQLQASFVEPLQVKEPTETRRSMYRSDVRYVAGRRMERMFGRMWQSKLYQRTNVFVFL